jgi:type II secretory pathway component GspD/PulD (secretin)
MELLKLRGEISALQQRNAQLAAGGGSGGPAPAGHVKTTYSSFDLPSEHPGDEPANGVVHFDGVDVGEVLNLYGALSKRTVVHGALPAAQIHLTTSASLTKIQVLQQMDTALAENGIAMVLSGDDAVKAVPSGSVPGESPPEITLPWQSLPDSSSPMTRTVRVKYYRPSEVVPLLQPYSKLPNSIMPNDIQNTLTLRDYSSCIKQELKVLESLDQKPEK